MQNGAPQDEPKNGRGHCWAIAYLNVFCVVCVAKTLDLKSRKQWSAAFSALKHVRVENCLEIVTLRVLSATLIVPKNSRVIDIKSANLS